MGVHNGDTDAEKGTGTEDNAGDSCIVPEGGNTLGK